MRSRRLCARVEPRDFDASCVGREPTNEVRVDVRHDFRGIVIDEPRVEAGSALGVETSSECMRIGASASCECQRDNRNEEKPGRAAPDPTNLQAYREGARAKLRRA
jgi:hypothetical protein